MHVDIVIKRTKFAELIARLSIATTEEQIEYSRKKHYKSIPLYY